MCIFSSEASVESQEVTSLFALFDSFALPAVDPTSRPPLTPRSLRARLLLESPPSQPPSLSWLNSMLHHDPLNRSGGLSFDDSTDSDVSNASDLSSDESFAEDAGDAAASAFSILRPSMPLSLPDHTVSDGAAPTSSSLSSPSQSVTSNSTTPRDAKTFSSPARSTSVAKVSLLDLNRITRRSTPSPVSTPKLWSSRSACSNSAAASARSTMAQGAEEADASLFVHPYPSSIASVLCASCRVRFVPDDTVSASTTTSVGFQTEQQHASEPSKTMGVLGSAVKKVPTPLILPDDNHSPISPLIVATTPHSLQQDTVIARLRGECAELRATAEWACQRAEISEQRAMATNKQWADAQAEVQRLNLQVRLVYSINFSSFSLSVCLFLSFSSVVWVSTGQSTNM